MRISIVVSSCDAFQDCWEPFVHSLKHVWPQSKIKTYLISNTKEIKDERVSFIKVGKDLGWASNLKKALLQIDSEYILYLQEDYFLTVPISDSTIEKHVEYMEKEKIDYLRLSAPFYNQYRISDSPYSKSPLKKRYALCLQAAIWKRSSFLEILLEGNTGWDFEYKIINYIKENNITIKSLVLHSDFFLEQGISYVDGTAVRKGKWTVAGAKYLKEMGFINLLESRKTEGSLINFLMHRNGILHPLAALLLRGINFLKMNI